MKNSKQRLNKAFTLVELVISLGIMAAIIVTIYGVFKYCSITVKSFQANVYNVKNGDLTYEYLTKDLSYSIQIKDFSSGMLPAENSNSSICFVLPSVHADLTVIDDDGMSTDKPVGSYIDYIYYYLDGTTLKKAVNVDVNAPYNPTGRGAPGSSYVETIAENIQSLSFRVGSSTGEVLGDYSVNNGGNLKGISVIYFKYIVNSFISKGAVTKTYSSTINLTPHTGESLPVT